MFSGNKIDVNARTTRFLLLFLILCGNIKYQLLRNPSPEKELPYLSIFQLNLQIEKSITKKYGGALMSLVQTSEFSVLLVDDEENLLNSLYMTLKSEGIKEVQRCNDSRLVLMMLKKKKFTVIILDVVMPHLRGDELLPEILQAYPSIRVIMLTAVQDKEFAKKCIKCGASGYLEKPVQASKLIESIKNIVEESCVEEKPMTEKLILNIMETYGG